jgi:hypothetical protein
MSFRTFISPLCICLMLVSATPIAVAQSQDGATTTKKKATKPAPKKSGGSNATKDGSVPTERGVGSY